MDGAVHNDGSAHALETYYPYYWASKFHLYITRSSFFNYPYTFGFLFGSGLYAAAQTEGTGFEENFRALLRDSASMTVEDLAAKHLGVDVRRPEFWERAVGMAVKDVDEFMRLTEGSGGK